MPSPPAEALTRRHQAELQAVAREVSRAVSALASRAVPLANVDGWFRTVLDRLLALVGGGWSASRTLGERYLVEHARIEGRAVVPARVRLDVEQLATSLRVTGPVAFKQSIAVGRAPVQARTTMAKTMAAASERLTLTGERDTVAATVEDSDEILGWRRVTDANPCAWCALLASRGSVYLSETSATRVVGRRGTARGNQGLGDAYHDGCTCIAEPLYAHEDEPQSVLDLQEQWLTVTAGTGGKNAVRAWRRHWDKQQKDGG
jgi:hypothetical protein